MSLYWLYSRVPRMCVAAVVGAAGRWKVVVNVLLWLDRIPVMDCCCPSAAVTSGRDVLWAPIR